MMLAIPLSKIAPNGSRFARLALAVGIYILYLNLVIVSCSWIKKGEQYGVMLVLLIHIIALTATYLTYNPRILRYASFR